MLRNVIAYAACLMVCITAAATTIYAETKPKVTVGALLPLNGPLSSIGQCFQQGIQLGIAEAHNVEFVSLFQDDGGGDPNANIRAAKQLTTVSKVDVLLSASGTSSSLLAPIINASGTPTLFLWDYTKKALAPSQNFIGFGYGAEVVAETLASFAHRRFGAVKVATIGLTDEWSKLSAQTFNDQFKKLSNIQPGLRLLSPAKADIQNAAKEAVTSKAAIVYLPLWGNTLQATIKALKKAAFKGSILTADTLYEADIRSLMEAAEGIYTIHPWLEDRLFKSKYEAVYGDRSLSPIRLAYASIGYDAIRLIDDIAGRLNAQNQAPRPAAIAKALPGTTYAGAFGDIMILPDRTSNRREVPLIVRGGEFEVPAEES